MQIISSRVQYPRNHKTPRSRNATASARSSSEGFGNEDACPTDPQKLCNPKVSAYVRKTQTGIQLHHHDLQCRGVKICAAPRRIFQQKTRRVVGATNGSVLPVSTY